MHTNCESEPERRLNEALRGWKIEEPLPAGFQAQVWNRIERGEKPEARGLRTDPLAAIFRFLARPGFAAACLSVCLAGGAVAGVATARVATHRLNAELGARYMQVIAPFRGDSGTP